MKKRILGLAATIALSALAVTPASAHRQWMMPSATVLSGDDVWVTVDAAVSNDLFYFEHQPLRLDGIKAWAPDGSEARGHLRTQARDIVLGEEPVRGAHGALPHLRQPAHQLGRAPLRLDLLDVHGCSFRMLPPGRFAPF